jgi:serine protease Do
MVNLTLTKQRFVKLAWGAAILLVVLSPIFAAGWLSRTSQAASPAVPAEVTGLESFQRGFTWVADNIKPSVVFIEVERKVEAPQGEGNSDQDLRDFFGPDFPFPLPTPRSRPEQPTPRLPMGQGSGVVIDSSGYILTNNHVISEAAKVTVHLENEDSYPAEIVGRDELTDLAVIKIQPKQPLRAAELGDADRTEVGAWAIAVGYPFGGSRIGGAFDEPLRYEPTITVGVVSATNRQIPSDREGHPFRGLLQTDAPINPGNSGGPLVNIRAQVIGINQAIYTNSPLGGGNIGVGFAIPINAKTKRIIETLKGGEKVVRGRLGISVSPITEALRKQYEVDHGVLALEIEPGSAADRAGIKSGDFILEFQGKPVLSQDEFVNAVQSTKPGTTVELIVLRDDTRVKIKATVEALPEAEVEKKITPAEPEKLGISVEALPAEVARKAKLEGGVRVKKVDPVSDGARAGVQAGDIIYKINRAQITDLASYRKAVGALKRGDSVVLWVSRSGRLRVLEIGSLSE